MSIEAVAWALTVPIGGNAKVILLGLANHAHPDGTEAYPSLDTLATYAACDRSTARRNVRKLAEDGWIEQRGFGPQGQAKYRLVLEGWQNATPTQAASEGVAKRHRGVAPMPPEPSLVKASSSSSDVPVDSEVSLDSDQPPARARAREAGPANVKGAGEGKVSEAPGDPVAVVWATYVEVMKPRHKELLPQERQVILGGLKATSLDECVMAIHGCKASPHHMGENDSGKKYNRLTHILRGKRDGKTTREQIEMMCGYLDKGSQIPSEVAAEILRAKERVRLGMTHPTIEYHRKNGEEAQTFLRSYGIEAEGREYEVAPGVVGLRVVFSGPAS